MNSNQVFYKFKYKYLFFHFNVLCLALFPLNFVEIYDILQKVPLHHNNYTDMKLCSKKEIVSAENEN